MFRYLKTVYLLAKVRRIEREMDRRMAVAESVQRFIIERGLSADLGRYMLINHNWDEDLSTVDVSLSTV